MRLQSATIRNGVWDTQHLHTPLVDSQTISANTNPGFALFVRYKGRRTTSGAMFLFSIPPQSMTIERSSNVSVTNTRHGYVVAENGLGAPTFTLQGHFGWQMRSVQAPPSLLPYMAPKSNAVYDQQMSDFAWFHLPWTNGAGAQNMLEKVINGKVTVGRFTQTLDGRQAYFALRDICVYYLEENQKRIAEGKKPYEMVFMDTLHTTRWVVVPKHPTLKRTADTQGTHPYTLELVGVYDDARPNDREVKTAWSH